MITYCTDDIVVRVEFIEHARVQRVTDIPNVDHNTLEMIIPKPSGLNASIEGFV